MDTRITVLGISLGMHPVHCIVSGSEQKQPSGQEFAPPPPPHPPTPHITIYRPKAIDKIISKFRRVSRLLTVNILT